MKPSTSLKNAFVHHQKSIEIIECFDDKIRELLQDDCAGISFSTDGLVIVYRGGNGNSTLNNIDIDKFLKLTDKNEALEILDRAAI